MKKRLAIFAVAFVVVLVALLLLALFADRLPRRLYSSPTEPRNWAETNYQLNFVEAPGELPVLSSTSEPPPHFDLDASVPGKIDIRWAEIEDGSGILLRGQRLEPDPGSNEVTLPNGQVLRLIAIAHSPGPPTLPDPPDSRPPRREGKLDWHDPLTLEPIAKPESLNLPVTRRLDDSPELFLAFSCSDVARRPVRWHSARNFNALTKAQLMSPVGRESYGDVMVFNSMDFACYHSTPLRISIPLSFGDTEVITVDYSQVGVFEFKKRPTQLRVLHAGDGYLSGSSWRGGDEVRHTTYDVRPVQDNSRRRSFTIFSVYPPMQASMIESYIPKSGGSRGRWSPVYADSGLSLSNHATPIAELGPSRVRQFPSVVRGIFSISGIPGLPEADNLFAVTMGRLRFDYENEFRRSIEQATGLQWIHSGGRLPDTAFPLDFADPATTPAELLEEYERLAQIRLVIDHANHAIVDPRTIRKRGVVDKLLNFLRRLF